MVALGDLQALALAVTRRRLTLGLTKEAAARKVDMSSITWKRVEDALPVRDDSYAKIEQALGWVPGSAAQVRGGADAQLAADSAPVRGHLELGGSVGRSLDDAGRASDSMYVTRQGETDVSTLTEDELDRLISNAVAEKLRRGMESGGAVEDAEGDG